MVTVYSEIVFDLHRIRKLAMKNHFILFLTIALIALFVQLPASAGATNALSALSTSERSEHLRVTSGGSIFIVNSNGDSGDVNTNDEICDTGVGECTLRAAIEEANSDNDHDIIRFSFTSATTIEPLTPLPEITNSVTIDGVIQNAATCPTATQPANLLVTLSGGNLQTNADASGLILKQGADNSIIRGLKIIEWRRYGIGLHGVHLGIDFNYLNDVTISCNLIGFTGSDNRNGTGVYGSGVWGLIIGGNTVADRNDISGNKFGIFIRPNDGVFDPVSVDVSILGNYIKNNSFSGAELRGVVSGSGKGIQAVVGTVAAPNIFTNNGHAFSDSRYGGLLISGSDTGQTSHPNPPVNVNYNEFNNNQGFGLAVYGVAQANLRHNTYYENEGWGLNTLGIKPQIISVSPTGLVTARIQNLPFLPGRTFTIDIYESDHCDNLGYGAGFGQGQHIVGSVTVIPDEVFYDFTYQLPTIPAVGTAITMMATSSGKSGMFSNCGDVGELIFTVTSHNDEPDADAGDTLCYTLFGTCTLRAAIQEINALSTQSTFQINFAITTTIDYPLHIGAALPTIHKQVFIDGTTSLGATCPTGNSAATGLVRINGSTNWMGDGLVLGSGSDGSTIQGLRIGSFFHGDSILVNSDHNRIQCNHIGGNNPGPGNGIVVTGNSNTIGGIETWQRNVIVRNTDAGIELSETASVNNILGNYIGTNGTSASFLGNGYGAKPAAALCTRRWMVAL